MHMHLGLHLGTNACELDAQSKPALRGQAHPLKVLSRHAAGHCRGGDEELQAPHSAVCTQAGG